VTAAARTPALDVGDQADLIKPGILRALGGRDRIGRCARQLAARPLGL
jgi:hypothetical protein